MKWNENVDLPSLTALDLQGDNHFLRITEVTLQNIPALDYMVLGDHSFSNVKKLSADSMIRGWRLMTRGGTIKRIHSKTDIVCLFERNKRTNECTKWREISNTKICSRNNNEETET